MISVRKAEKTAGQIEFHVNKLFSLLSKFGCCPGDEAIRKLHDLRGETTAVIKKKLPWRY